MARCPQHTFQVLTKRAERMAELIAAIYARRNQGGAPLANVWLGVSVEDQERADERIPHLLRTPAAVRFLSVEPLLGPVDLRGPLSVIDVHDLRDDPLASQLLAEAVREGRGDSPRAIGWCIVGGESGDGARPMRVEWARSLVEQCRAAGVATFVKQWGSRPRVGFYDDARDDFENLGHDWTPVGWSEGDGQPQPDALVELRLPKKGGELAAVPGEWPRQFPEVRRAD
jgi:protein gp37